MFPEVYSTLPSNCGQGLLKENSQSTEITSVHHHHEAYYALLCVFYALHVCSCVQVHICAYSCEGKRITFVDISQGLITFFFEAGFLSDLPVSGQVGKTSWRANCRDQPGSASPALGLYMAPCLGSLCMDYGAQAQVLVSALQAFYLLVYFPQPLSVLLHIKCLQVSQLPDPWENNTHLLASACLAIQIRVLG